MKHYANRFATPMGTFVAAVDHAGALLAIDFDAEGRLARWEGLTWASEPVRHVQEALARYFEGALREFDLPLAPRGTPFQQRVWGELRRIPYAETISYAELAIRIGEPRAVRAVGSANGANPIPILIPCHRVIGSNGKLTGYAGGLERKRALLALETRHSGRPVQLSLTASEAP